jgi:hypothetical protein
MPYAADPRSFTFALEGALGGGPPTDWATDGRNMLVIEPDVSGVTQTRLDNENIRPSRLDVLPMIPGLKSESTVSWSMYWHAAGVSAAEASQATSTDQSTIYKAALGGERLCWSTGFQGTGTAAAPELDADPGFVAGDWGFAYDASAGRGLFVRLEAVSAGPAPFVATLLDPLDFSPDDVGDVWHATILNYPDQGALDNPDDPNHETLAVLVTGDHPEDVYELLGVKPAMSIEGLAAGELVRVAIEAGVTNYPDQMPAKPTIPGAPSGIAPLTVASGSSTTVRLADLGAPLAAVNCRGTIEIELGIGWDRTLGACGAEGSKGWFATIEPATITITLAFDDDFDDDFFTDPQPYHHVLIQIGDQPTNATAIYFPKLEIMEKPVRVDEQGTTSIQVKWRAHIDPAAAGSPLTGDDLDRRRAPFVLIQAA